MNENETYCTACHGRCLDQYDHTCKHCQGTGYEPVATFESNLRVWIRPAKEQARV